MTDPTTGWTLTTRDSVGRVKSTEQFGSATNPPSIPVNPPAPWGNNTTSTGKVHSSYNQTAFGCSGPATTVMDEAGNSHTYCPDGLGRMARVTDPNGNVTTYSYDVLDDLTAVNMGSQTPRTFQYDPLGRLICASNPESATASCTGSPLPTSRLERYVYDGNSNLTAHTDAREAVTSMTYDGLNRLVTKIYATPSPTAVTPTVTNSYDHDTKGTLY